MPIWALNGAKRDGFSFRVGQRDVYEVHTEAYSTFDFNLTCDLMTILQDVGAVSVVTSDEVQSGTELMQAIGCAIEADNKATKTIDVVKINSQKVAEEYITHAGRKSIVLAALRSVHQEQRSPIQSAWSFHKG